MRDETPASRRPRSWVFGLALLSGCVIQQVTPAASAPPVEHPEAAVEEFVTVANEARREAGCRDLEWRSDVAAVAQAHSDDMRARDYFDHVNPEGRTPLGRVGAASIPITALAENIALGQPTGRAVLRSWLDSPGHRRNLLNCEYTHHGVGLAGAYWTHLLVRLTPRG